MATPDNMDNWNALAAQQRDTRETEQMAQNQKLFDGFVNIETAARDRQLALNHQRAIAGAAMIDSAFRNGGMSDRSLSQAFSEAFGQPIYGGQILDLPDGKGKAFVMYGATKDQQTGEAKVAPVAMMDSTQMMKVLQSAKLGGRTEGVQKAIYGDLSSRFTPDQLGKMGIQNPSAPISTGGVVISGAGMRALRGEPRPRSRISTFAADGKGGFSRSYSGPETGFQTVSADGGTRSPERREEMAHQWKPLASGPQGERYRNAATGEVVDVPAGTSLRDVLRSGGSERERIAQMNNDSREKRAQIAADATREKAQKAYDAVVERVRAAEKKASETKSSLSPREMRLALKDFLSIGNDAMSPEELRKPALENAARISDWLDKFYSGNEGGADQPKPGGDNGGKGNAQGGETIEEKKARLEAMKRALEEKRKAKQK